MKHERYTGESFYSRRMAAVNVDPAAQLPRDHADIVRDLVRRAEIGQLWAEPLIDSGRAGDSYIAGDEVFDGIAISGLPKPRRRVAASRDAWIEPQKDVSLRRRLADLEAQLEELEFERRLVEAEMARRAGANGR